MIRRELHFHQLSNGQYKVGKHEACEAGWHQTAQLWFVSLVCTDCLNFGYGYSDIDLSMAVTYAAANLEALPCMSGIGQWVAPMLSRR